MLQVRERTLMRDWTANTPVRLQNSSRVLGALLLPSVIILTATIPEFLESCHGQDFQVDKIFINKGYDFDS